MVCPPPLFEQRMNREKEQNGQGQKNGKTWWGNAWVDALAKIYINTNRLPGENPMPIQAK